MINVCLIDGTSLAVGKRCNVEWHFIVHSNFSWNFPAGSSECKEMVKELKTTLREQQSCLLKDRYRRRVHPDQAQKALH